MKLAVASLVAAFALGAVLYFHGERRDVGWAEGVGACLLWLAIVGTFWGGLALVWALA